MHNVRLFYLFLLIVMMFTLVSKSLAEGLSGRGEDLVSMLQKKYEATTDITSHFEQETFASGSSEGLKAEGKVYFKRPHQMRWEYRQPEPQLIVTSGQEVYVYEEEANQVMVLPRDQLLSTEISRAFFFGKGDLKRFFIVEHPVKGQADARWMLKLTPRNPVPQVCTIWIVVDSDTHLVKEMWLEDQLGGRTHLVFSDVKVNKGLSDGLFQFVPPPGVEIYRTDDSKVQGSKVQGSEFTENLSR
jgi:outer membrane lipoprotein carrier protein